jgi:uncharacterized membrane protein
VSEVKIKPNIGNPDRIIRAIVGIALMVIAFLILGAPDGRVGGIIAAVLGVLLIVTAITRYCVGYALFHYSTLKNK